MSQQERERSWRWNQLTFGPGETPGTQLRVLLIGGFGAVGLLLIASGMHQDHSVAIISIGIGILVAPSP